MFTGYYQTNKEKPSKKAHEKYQNLSEEKRDKKLQYACERHSNLSEA